MNFDLFCLGVVALLALLGLFRGLLRQIFGVVGFIGGIVLARLFAQSFGDAFAKDLGLPNSVAVAAMGIAIFLAAEIVAKILGGFLHKRMEGGFTGAVNRFGGLLVGLAKGVLVAWALASLITLVRPHLQHLENDTVLSKLQLRSSHAIRMATDVNLVTEIRQKAR